MNKLMKIRSIIQVASPKFHKHSTKDPLAQVRSYDNYVAWDLPSWVLPELEMSLTFQEDTSDSCVWLSFWSVLWSGGKWWVLWLGRTTTVWLCTADGSFCWMVSSSRGRPVGCTYDIPNFCPWVNRGQKPCRVTITYRSMKQTNPYALWNMKISHNGRYTSFKISDFSRRHVPKRNHLSIGC